jgi:hypothetical protein
MRFIKREKRSDFPPPRDMALLSGPLELSQLTKREKRSFWKAILMVERDGK